MNELGIYVHIPFCKKKCHYCDFASFTCQDNIIEKYIKALLKEISNSSCLLKEHLLKTIYIGGGTPSYIDSKYIKEILSLFKTLPIDVTIEVNPGTVTEQKLLDYLKSRSK